MEDLKNLNKIVISDKKSFEIGIKYLNTFLFFFISAGTLALIMRFHHWPGDTLNISELSYNRAFTFHGAMMMFLFAMPVIQSVFGNLLHCRADSCEVPKSQAFNQLALITYKLSCFFLLFSILIEPYHVGWSLYFPIEIKVENKPAMLAFNSLVLLHLSSVLLGCFFFVETRRKIRMGLSLSRLPVFIQTIYLFSILTIVTAPVLLLSVGLIFIALISPKLILSIQFSFLLDVLPKLFVYYSHPSVYLIILPAVGLMSNMFSSEVYDDEIGRDRIFHVSSLYFIGFLGLVRIVLSYVSIFFGDSLLPIKYVSSFLMDLLALPMVVLIFCWIRKLVLIRRIGRSYQIYELYGLLSVILLVIGVITGLYLSFHPSNASLYTSYFLVAHFHSILIGGPVFALIGGGYYVVRVQEQKVEQMRMARIAGMAVLLGYVLSFIPQFYMGWKGVNRHMPDIAAEFKICNQISLVGSSLMGLALIYSIGMFYQVMITEKKRA